VSPGAADATPSVFAIDRSGAASTDVVSDAWLFAGSGSGPWAASSAMLAVLEIVVRPAGAGETSVTANVTEPDPAAAIVPTVSVQVVPDGLASGHDQPAVLALALKVVLAGTVSVITEPVAGWFPLFE
jgi:hypothetical protein